MAAREVGRERSQGSEGRLDERPREGDVCRVNVAATLLMDVVLVVLLEEENKKQESFRLFAAGFPAVCRSAISGTDCSPDGIFKTPPCPQRLRRRGYLRQLVICTPKQESSRLFAAGFPAICRSAISGTDCSPDGIFKTPPCPQRLRRRGYLRKLVICTPSQASSLQTPIRWNPVCWLLNPVGHHGSC